MVKHFSSMVAVNKIPHPSEGDTATTDEDDAGWPRCWRYCDGRWVLLGAYTEALSTTLIAACDDVVVVMEPDE